MFSQLWSGSRNRDYQAARDQGRRRRAFRPGMDWLDERCLLSAHVLSHLNQAIPASVGVGGEPALVAITVPGPKLPPSGGVLKAESAPLSHNLRASSSATNGGALSTSSSLASSTGPTALSITEIVPRLFAGQLTTTAPPAVSAPTTAQSAVIPLGPSSAPAGSFGRSLLVSQEQIPQSSHLGPEDDLGGSEASGAAVDEKKQEEPFVKIIEAPKATVPTKVPEQRPEPEPEPAPEPILPDENLESALDVLDCGLITALFQTGSSRPENAPNEPYSSPGFWAMLPAAALSAAALPLAIPVPTLSLWRRVERRQHSKLPDLSKAKASRTDRERERERERESLLS
jgi:hypothetical protein